MRVTLAFITIVAIGPSGAGQVCDTPENANGDMNYRWHCVTATAENGVGFQPRYTDAQARTFDSACKVDTDCSVLTACTLGRDARICRSLCTADSDCRYMTLLSTSDGVCVAGRCEKCDPGRAETCDPSTVCRLAPPPDYGHCAPACGSDTDCRGTGLFCVGRH